MYTNMLLYMYMNIHSPGLRAAASGTVKEKGRRACARCAAGSRASPHACLLCSRSAGEAEVDRDGDRERKGER